MYLLKNVIRLEEIVETGTFIGECIGAFLYLIFLMETGQIQRAFLRVFHYLNEFQRRRLKVYGKNVYKILSSYLKDEVQNNSDNGNQLNSFRQEISDSCRQAAETDQKLYRLTVPTGAGKTLSSLRFALYHAKRCKSSEFSI